MQKVYGADATIHSVMLADKLMDRGDIAGFGSAPLMRGSADLQSAASPLRHVSLFTERSKESPGDR